MDTACDNQQDIVPYTIAGKMDRRRVVALLQAIHDAETNG